MIPTEFVQKDASEIINRNELDEIINAFSLAKTIYEKPTLIIFHNIPGKGVSFMEDKLEWHYKNLTKEYYEKALDELK